MQTIKCVVVGDGAVGKVRTRWFRLGGGGMEEGTVVFFFFLLFIVFLTMFPFSFRRRTRLAFLSRTQPTNSRPNTSPR